MRRDTTNRMTLERVCGTCGRNMMITADTPFLRIIVTRDEDGKKHYKSTYYCCDSCKRASYTYDMYANQVEKRAEKDRRYRETHRDEIRQKNKEYYQKNKEREKARQKAYRESHYEQCLEAVRYNHQKRRLMALGGV